MPAIERAKETLNSPSHIENTPSYKQLKQEHLLGLHSLRAIYLEFDGLGRDQSGYNAIAVVFNNRLLLIPRFEAADPDDERSILRTAEAKKGLWVPNGIIARNAQDPAVGLFDRYQIGFSYVSTSPRPEDPKLVGSVRVLVHPLVSEHRFNADVTASGPVGEKDLRFAYMGNNKTAIVARERVELNVETGDVESFFQIRLADTNGDLNNLSKEISALRRNPNTKLDIIRRQPNLWVGPNGIYPQDETHALMLFHTGKYTGRTHRSGQKEREYAAFITELEFNPETGYVQRHTRPIMIGSTDNLPDELAPPHLYSGPKRPDLGRVFFPTSLVFVMDNDKSLQSVYLFGGKGDKGMVALQIDPHLIQRPIHTELNPLSIIQKSELPQSLRLAA